ncbi:5'-nucleotidase, lipoprotein e(P4) family [Halobacteriovorax marinus]|uniref:5'-nucleotidase, lipoprotein e(P4) family n=1 Tax=Halobacteriovorax marinus TaxID=97084 RepID=A0A1Y5F445_9BACT|nr:5'-nucleotidase, lipoprotein e(P4) family [Halobacteriovorax marinus]
MKNVLMIIALVLMSSCASSDKDNLARYTESSTLWIQNGAEVRALAYQAFNTGKVYLNRVLRKKMYKLKPAIVVDIDETLLDNSPYQAKNILDNRLYNSKDWKVWIDLAQAKAVPGSIDYLNYVRKRGVKVIYISNRKIRGLDATYKNLLELGFPVKRQDIYLRTTTSNKEERRQKILKNYTIVQFIGDALGDFSEDFHKKGTNDRNILVDKMRGQFGTKFIVLPNPMYGDWEGALYNYEYSKTPQQKEKLRMRHLYPHN